jgi:ketopantoate reductase
LEGCVNEACAVGVAEGAKVAPEPILKALEGVPNGFRSSMQKDVAAGRPPELDAIAGPSSVAALSTASTCQRPAPFWTGSRR